mmetsp:Transcript_22529/g.57447  ORF Transcript_22529/g.57447 Transcript_22529/m.57447 type:complete len:206 (-) Transcript_22529:1385-2002(-)
MCCCSSWWSSIAAFSPSSWRPKRPVPRRFRRSTYRTPHWYIKYPPMAKPPHIVMKPQARCAMSPAVDEDGSVSGSWCAPWPCTVTFNCADFLANMANQTTGASAVRSKMLRPEVPTNKRSKSNNVFGDALVLESTARMSAGPRHASELTRQDKASDVCACTAELRTFSRVTRSFKTRMFCVTSRALTPISYNARCGPAAGFSFTN